LKLPKKPYTLVGFEPTIFWSRGGRDDHYICLAAIQGSMLSQFSAILSISGKNWRFSQKLMGMIKILHNLALF
jgi:hypothetical protein